MPDSVPPVPTWLAHLPTVGGLVVPWNTVRTADGRHLLGAVDRDRNDHALRARLCGVCGHPLDRPLVTLLRLSDFRHQATTEPALHPVCAAYTTRACPMLAGRLSHHRTSPPRLDPTMQPGTDAEARRGAPSEPWFSVWLSTYQLGTVHGHLAASYAGTTPLRVRPITWRVPGLFT